MAESILVLVRHGQSEWNAKNLFTGWKDPDLTQKGVDEAMDAGRKLKAAGYSFELAYTSELLRAQKNARSDARRTWPVRHGDHARHRA